MEKKYSDFTKKCFLINEKDIEDFFIYHKKWYPWKYNEIIGYLNLRIYGNQLRINCWKVDKNRHNKGITLKQFSFFGETLQTTIPAKLDSIEIMNFIKAKLFDLNRKEFKNYHFDLQTFITIGAFVNWAELIEKLNPFNI